MYMYLMIQCCVFLFRLTHIGKIIIYFHYIYELNSTKQTNWALSFVFLKVSELPFIGFSPASSTALDAQLVEYWL